MKTKFITSFLISTMFLVLCVACSSNDDGNNNSNQNSTITAITNNMQSGSWVVTYFFDTDTNETNHFTGFTFNFGSNGVLTATNGVETFTGNWSVTNSSSSNSSDDIHFNISFTAPTDFEDLTDDWDIVSYNSTNIQLTDVSGGNGGTDFLTFQKQ